MHEKHKLGTANLSTYSYQNWQNLLRMSNAHPTANPKISNAFWHMKAVTLKEQTNVLKYRTDTLYNGKHARRFSGHPGPSLCPLCGAPDSTSHTLLRCTHPQINRMNINRHHQALSICGEAISKGDFGSYIVSTDAFHTERLRSLDMEIPNTVHRHIPHWLFPSRQPPHTQLSRPDGIIVLPLEGRDSTHHPQDMNPRDRDIHLIELKFCSDTKPEQTLHTAQNQHKHTIESLRTRSLRGTHRNNRVTLHTILIGVAGTIFNPYTIDPLCKLGLTKDKAHKTAKELHYHAVKSLTKIHNTKNAIQFSNISNGGLGEGATGRAAYRTARRAAGRMADDPPDPH